MKRITREWLRANNACYSDEKIAELVPPEGLTLLEVLRRKDIPDADKIWVSTRPYVLARGILSAFAKGCAERVSGYAAFASYAAAFAALDAAFAASAAYRAASDAAYYAHLPEGAERSAQVKHLIEILSKEGET